MEIVIVTQEKVATNESFEKAILTLREIKNSSLFQGGDIVFENIEWTRSSRGVIRGGASNIR